METNQKAGIKKFSFNSINDFDEHIQKSIPRYDILFENILSMGEYFFTKEVIDAELKREDS